jgi:hypothetical protein
MRERIATDEHGWAQMNADGAFAVAWAARPCFPAPNSTIKITEPTKDKEEHKDKFN